MFKRYGLFFLVNIGVVVTLSIVASLFGLNSYYTQYGINYEQMAIFCLFWGMGGSFISLAMSKFAAKMFYGVQIVSERDGYGQLIHKVQQMAKAAGLSKMPEVGIYDSPEVNAFATGPSKNNSLVAVSTGLLNSMSEDEVEGVLAHEVSHIANGDMVTMALLQGVVNAFVMFFARIATFALQNVLRGDDEEGGFADSLWGHIIIRFVFEIIFSFLSMFIIAYFSRIREYRADAGAAKLVGRGKMVAALQRLKRQYEGPNPNVMPNDNMAAFKISSGKAFMELLSTHPRLDDRIEALNRA